MNVLRGQFPQASLPDLFRYRHQDVPVLLNRPYPASVQPGREPVIDRLPHRIGRGGLDVARDLIPQRLQLVANLSFGPPAHGAAPTLAIGGVPERHRSDPVPVRLIEVDAVLAVP